MGQIFGLGGVYDAEKLHRSVSEMGRVMRRPNQPDPILWLDTARGVGLGYIPEDASSTRLDSSADGGRTPIPCVVDGVFYRGALTGVPRPEASLLARGVEKRDLAFDDLDGSFSFALYLEEQRRFIVATDRFATRAVYWTEWPGGVLFASELKAILATRCVSVELDQAALAQCAGFNRILGNRTIVRGVSRLPGGGVLEWNEGSGARMRRYWRPENLLAERRPLTAERRDQVVEAFRDAVRVRTSHATSLGLSLSGGLDSRAIAAVLRAEGIRASSCTTGFTGSADQRLAAQVSRVAHTDHHFLELRREVIADYPQALHSAAFVRDELLLFGGFPGRLTEQFCAAHGVRTLLRGHGGENLKLAEAWPFQVNPAVAGMRSLAELGPHLRRVLSSCPADVDLDRLLPDADAGGASRSLDAAIEEALRDHGTLTAPEVMSALYLTQNDGREVPLTRNGLRGLADMALPFLDYRLLDLVLATRVEDRCGVDIHIAIIRRFAAPMLKIGNSNTGAAVDASPLRVFITDKANTLMKRLRIPGFRHYHYMDEWLQGFLAEQVRAIVLSERTLSRGVFPPDVLKDLMERGRRDHRMSRLVNFIMNVEIWCRLFMDGEATQERNSV